MLAGSGLMQYGSVMARQIVAPHTDLITATKEGLWRVAGTRVSVDSVVHAFWRGSTPEQIVQDYEALTLAQVYGLIHFYLTHRAAVDAYLKKQDRLDNKLRRDLKTHHAKFSADLRRRLDARRRSGNRAA
jgi:uncharacterized protein (DUF433 family)